MRGLGSQRFSVVWGRSVERMNRNGERTLVVWERGH